MITGIVFSTTLMSLATKPKTPVNVSEYIQSVTVNLTWTCFFFLFEGKPYADFGIMLICIRIGMQQGGYRRRFEA